MSRRRILPTGTITFLFSDIEGSTRLGQVLDQQTYRAVLETHHRLLRAAFARHGGIERGTQGDAFLVLFRDAPSAVAAAVDAQRSLHEQAWPAGAEIRVRMGLHSGEGILGGDDYVGPDVNRAARIASAAHGGQVLISESTRALARRTMQSGVQLVDLGEHWLRDLDAPERLFQLGIEDVPSAFPPIRGRTAPVQLPVRLTSFVGREAAIAELERLSASNRLITLTGPGGTGKTSLASEFARMTAHRFVDGAWNVALESIVDPGHVASAIVGALDLRDASSRPARERLIENLSQRSLLLVLDNFEHLVDAASIVADIVAAAPGVAVLVTSRTPLHVSAEQVYPVGPLAVPSETDRASFADLEAVPSVRLFVERSRRVEPDFELTTENSEAVADICRSLDGLPLGIELAAGQVAHLGPAGIRDRLNRRVGLPGAGQHDRPSRHQTLADAIAWSRDLLDEPARRLLARLSVFVGGCRSTELVAVCGPAQEIGADVEETVFALVDQNMVTAKPSREGDVRFGMLETIRTDAASRLAEAPDSQDIARRHALAYLNVAEGDAPKLPGRGQTAVLDRLADERDNFREALRWAIATGDADVAQRLAAALWRFWQFRGEFDEGRAIVAAVLAMPGGQAVTRSRMLALEAAGGLAYWLPDFDTVTEMYKAQLEIAEELGDLQAIADAWFNSAFIHAAGPRRDTKLGTRAIRYAAEIYANVGDERSLARTKWVEGVLLLTEGRLEAALALLEEAYARYRELDDIYYEGTAAGYMANVHLRMGNEIEALRWFLVWIRASEELGDLATLVRLVEGSSEIFLRFGDAEAAATMLAAHQVLSARYGMASMRGLVPDFMVEDPMERARATLDSTTFQHASARGRAMLHDEAVAYLLDATERLLERARARQVEVPSTI
jgi:predicted ATPase/class 3 adenylate cyclase